MVFVIAKLIAGIDVHGRNASGSRAYGIYVALGLCIVLLAGALLLADERYELAGYLKKSIARVEAFTNRRGGGRPARSRQRPPSHCCRSAWPARCRSSGRCG